ncbi:acyl carrier protein [Pelagivirga sediminicola]|uniref:[acyl-carrier-protein] S-malonyltransferase n=1 Tax=Pelagivirga sediminicola TaxID=2170575 RepID=A0A2T7G7C0_9RHOB|nr:ACP S-malonyltransferase [Pelagivirga sediminicola]PVA10313.1 acyl carrier protein [Pelagivirga sediminicola]
MTCRAVLICPGRGTYNKPELGYLQRHHAGHPLLDTFDDLRRAEGQTPVTELDGAERFSNAVHTVGDAASPLIYAASYLDRRALAEDIELVAVTGNSMGWYIALAAAGALDAEGGFQVVNTMGRLMQEASIGGQLVYPCIGPDWRADPARKADLLATVAQIDAGDAVLRLSIDLGGMLVLAGDEAGLKAFEAAVPRLDERFPMRLPHHAAFHTHLQGPVAQQGRDALPASLFHQPELPMIDGRGAIWWPGATDTSALYDYTLGHQVTEPYDFTRAIQIAAREFAPDMFIVTGPGNTLGGAVAQSLVAAGWGGMDSKEAFQARQADTPLLVSMGLEEQRAVVTD